MTAVVLALVGVAATPAMAAEDRLAAAKRITTARIDGRLAFLKALTVAVNNARALSSSHKSTLSSLINSDTSGLTALKTKVAGETTVDAVKADATSMVNDYRIYLLVGPKVRLVIAADNGTAVAAKLAEIRTRLSDAIDKAAAGGADVTDAKAKLADLDSKLAAANTALAGQADAALAIQPGPDGDAIRAALQPIRASIHTAREDLRAAVADAKAIRDFLKGL
jgi:hypothetical protein